MADIEQVIKWLGVCCYMDGMEQCDLCPYNGHLCWIGLRRDAVELLIARKPADGWISVVDRLPGTYERVITYDKYSGVRENWLLKSMPCVSWSQGFHVTHWMPLPEPPKGDHDAAD